MKPLFSLLLTLALLCSFAGTPATTEAVTETPTYVYICTGGSSTKYHKTSTCRGLNNCKGRIVKVAKEDAEKNTVAQHARSASHKSNEQNNYSGTPGVLLG